MAYRPVGREASPAQGVHRYERHRPEQTLLYQLVEQHYPAFVETGTTVPITLTLIPVGPPRYSTWTLQRIRPDGTLGNVVHIRTAQGDEPALMFGRPDDAEAVIAWLRGH